MRIHGRLETPPPLVPKKKPLKSNKHDDLEATAAALALQQIS